MATNTKQQPEPEVRVDVLSALLDFYADRATGFASLFVASIFGLVTLAAIIQNYLGNSPCWYFISGVPYFAFVLSGYYTWGRFRYWAGIASNLEFGLRKQYKSEIEKIQCLEESKKINLHDYIQEKHREQKNGYIKRMLDLNRDSFTVLYCILVIGLTLITYWDFLTWILV